LNNVLQLSEDQILLIEKEIIKFGLHTIQGKIRNGCNKLVLGSFAYGESKIQQ
jgi:hypothetical protein